jgi:hypothetical protein
MINVAEVVSDPDLCQTVTVQRSHGAFALGGWSDSQATTSTFPISAVVTVASENDLRQVPEGDRVAGAMMFHTTQPLYLTHGATPQAADSDILVWNGNRYRLIKIWPYVNYGYYKAMGVRMSGE